VVPVNYYIYKNDFKNIHDLHYNVTYLSINIGITWSFVN
jgi:hypothetical protein